MNRPVDLSARPPRLLSVETQVAAPVAAVAGEAKVPQLPTSNGKQGGRLNQLSASRTTLAVWSALGLALTLALASPAAAAESELSPAVAPEPAAVAVVQLLTETEIRDGIAPRQRAHMEAAA